MGRKSFLGSFPAALGLLGIGLLAGAAHPDPLDGNAPVPAWKYQSPFEGYRPFADEKIKPWRESNELARRLGGWSAFAGGKTPDAGVPEPGSDAKSQPVVPAPPKPEGAHSGHVR
jgi:hypothetical protein